MKKVLSVIAGLFLLFGTAFASGEGDRAKLQDRLDSAGNILTEVMSAPDKGIPSEILSKAKCIAVIPSLIKGGLGIGGEYGQGVATCRTATGWSAPAFYRVGGGSFGLQIGGEAVDLVMLFMNQKGMDHLLSDKVKLGADASAAAGPIGRHVSGDTDVALRAEILTYSRSRGAFAGVSLNGSWIQQNGKDTRAFYGRDVPFQTVLRGGVKPPAGSQTFLASVRKNFGEAKAEESAKK